MKLIKIFIDAIRAYKIEKGRKHKVYKGMCFYDTSGDKCHVAYIIKTEPEILVIFKYYSKKTKSWNYNIMTESSFNLYADTKIYLPCKGE